MDTFKINVIDSFKRVRKHVENLEKQINKLQKANSDLKKILAKTNINNKKLEEKIKKIAKKKATKKIVKKTIKKQVKRRK